MMWNWKPMLCSKLMFFVVCIAFCLAVEYTDARAHHGDYELNIRMPHAVSERPDMLMCTGEKLRPEEAYIVKYTPHANRTTAHHLMVFGCTEPANQEASWLCDRSDTARSENSVCANGEERQILFAWALDAPAKALPEGVGFRIAGNTNIKYLVIQMHYAKKFSDGETDSSGITLHITHQRPPQQMGFFILGSIGSVPPQQKEVHVEAACMFEDDTPIYPIGYRTHSHSLGVVTSGYRIRDGKWTEIGRMSPQLPETFYNITNPGMAIRKGDILASRCTMNSMTRTDITNMGPTSHDEMCNFYMMYSTYDQANLVSRYCFPQNRNFSWDKELQEYLPAPANASSLDGIPNADYVRNKFNMTRTSS